VKRKHSPSYVVHRASGQGRAVWYDHTGKRCQKLLPGAFESQLSLNAFHQLQRDILETPRRSIESGAITINELLLAFVDHAEEHYRRKDGTITDEYQELKRVCKLVREVYGETIVDKFGPLSLKALRQNFISQGWSRGFVNQRIGKIRRIFQWGVSEELVQPTTLQALQSVQGLQSGRTKARETDPVGPVDDAVVDATLPFLARHVRGMVELQRLTGMRPGEVCVIRRCDIDTGGSVWLYTPLHHKMAHKKRSRVIAIGPRAQELLKQFFTVNREDYLFSPLRSRCEYLAERAERRKTPRYPSHQRRNEEKRKANPERVPADRYNRNSYALAIDRACDKAFHHPKLARCEGETLAEWNARLTREEVEELKVWQKAHRWSPNQLRHSHATKVRKTFGLEAAGAALGHTKMSATEVYAERDAQLAATVAARLG
jgi:integrase